MSDLFCAATVIVSRHGEAEYDEPHLASDDGGSLTLLGREQSRRLAESLVGRRVAAIWCSDMSRAVQTAEIVAAALGVPVRVRPGLRELSVGDFAGESYTDDVVRRVRAELESIADQYRGETVLVVTHGGTMSMVLPRLAGQVRDDFGAGKALDNVGTCELAVDTDGWVLRTWNGQPLSAYLPA